MDKPDILKGSVLAIIAFFFMALFGVGTKIALESGSFIWISFIAYLTATLALTPYVAYKGVSYLKSQHYGLLLGRALFGTLASFVYTISIHYIPIVNSTLLFNTAPIFIPILSVIFLKATISRAVWLAVILGFLGILIIIQPTLEIFTQVGNLLGLLSGIFLAIAYLQMKLLTNSDPSIRIIFYYLGIGTLIQAPLLFFFEEPSSYLFAVLSGLALVTAQITLVNAYRFAKASEIGIYQYASVIFVGILDWIIWKSVPPVIDILGVVLVTLAGGLIIYNGKNESR